MGPVRILIVVAAVASGVGALVLARGLSKAQPAPVVAVAPAVVEKPSSQVLVAKRDLPLGAKLKVEDMTWQSWPVESLNPAFIVQAAAPKAQGEVAKISAAASDLAKTAVGSPDAALAELVGAVVREPILANEPMTERKLVKAGSAGIMAVTLQPGMRAMAVPLSAESAAGGFILPGDHVDVVQSRQLEGQNGGSGGKRFVSGTVLKNVKVLAIDQNTLAPPKGSSVVGATATLELSAVQSEVLVLAKAQGDLTLVLRSYADAGGPTVTVAQNDGDDASFKASVVKVFRSGAPSEVMVTR